MGVMEPVKDQGLPPKLLLRLYTTKLYSECQAVVTVVVSPSGRAPGWWASFILYYNHLQLSEETHTTEKMTVTATLGSIPYNLL